jgi:hypothetical protein
VTITAFDHRQAKTIGVVVKLLQGAALRADVSLREDVVAITANPRDCAVFHRDL